MTPSPRTFYLKGTDLDIVRWLADFKFLQPRHFVRLSGRHVVAVRRRLRQLMTQSYVERLTLPLERSRPMASPPDEFVYRLGRRGVALAREHVDDDLTFNSEKKATFLEHDLAITDFHLALALAIQETSRLELRWRQRELQDWALGQNGERLSVNPDALFSLIDKSLPAGQNTHHYFLEFERSRQHSYERGESAVVRKMRAFELYARQGRHREAWGIHDFRVLTITPTRERALNLCAKLVEHELPMKRFWFSDSTRWSLETPTSVLDPIFVTPRDSSTTLYSLMPTR